MKDKTIKLELTEEQYEIVACRFLEGIIRIQVEKENETDKDYIKGLNKEIKMLLEVYTELERQKMEQQN